MDFASEQDRDTLVTPFLQLRSSQGRRRALQSLVESLTHYQIRELRNAIDGVDLHYDIVAELPLELSQVILQYLPFYQCFQAQRVSRKWKSILSSPSTLECIFQHWYPTTSMGSYIPDDSSAISTASLKAEHIDAFKTGRPFSMRTYDLSIRGGLDAKRFAYADGVLAWIDPMQDCAIKALDLRTGIEGEFVTENRHMLMQVAMSSSIMVGLSPSARCCVWDLSTLDQVSLQLPSANSRDLTVSRTTLAIASFQTRIVPQFEVVTWDLRTRLTQSFFVDSFSQQPENGYLWRMNIDRQGETVIIFESTYHSDSLSSPDHLYFTRTNLKGDVLFRGSIGLGCIANAIGHNMASFFDVDGSGAPWVYSGLWRDLNNGTEAQEVFRITFNFEKNRFDTTTYELNVPTERVLWKTRFFFWKGVLYSFATLTARHHTVIDLREASLQRFNMAPRVMLPDSWIDADSSWCFESEGLLLGDDTFLVHILPSGFCVWCFDKNIRMANENIEYKYARQAGLLRIQRE